MDMQAMNNKTPTGIEHEQNVTHENLLLNVNNMKTEGARFITITARDMKDKIHLIYHFDLNRTIANLYLINNKEKPVPSITGIYKVAFIAENEVQDLFGQKFVAINIDLGGKMLKIAPDIGTDMHKAVSGPQPPIKRFYGKCREECPAMVNIPKYLRQIAVGDSVGAYNTIVDSAPLPAVLGRVCFAPYQTGCRQEHDGKPIQIRMLKRYASDVLREQYGGFKRSVVRMETTGKQIAVVGGGPSGVTAAYYLGMLGHNVTLYEKRGSCGGAMLWGIPKYRLPKDVLEEEIQARLREAGVELKLGVLVENLDDLLKEDFDVAYIAVGSEKPNNLRCEGEDSSGVIDCKDFLTSVNVYNETPEVGDKVIVIGGGNSAMDSARTAIRLGAKDVTIYYRRTEDEMPALLHEVHSAMKEGVSFEFLSQQIKITPGKPLQIEFQSMIPGEPDDSGRRRPVPVEGFTFKREADTVIAAIGTSVDVPKGFNLEVNRSGRIIVDENYQSNISGIFAGGDAVFGPKSVIEAIRDGRKAASAIDEYLGGDGLPEPIIDMTEFVSKPDNLEELEMLHMAEPRELDPYERTKGFEEVELSLKKKRHF